MTEKYEYLDRRTKRYIYVAALTYKKLKYINPQITSLETGEKLSISTNGKKLLSLLLAVCDANFRSEMKNMLDSNYSALLRKNLYDVIGNLSIGKGDELTTADLNEILNNDFFDVLNTKENGICSKNISSPESLFTMFCLSQLSRDDIHSICTLFRNYDLRNKTSGSVENFAEYIFRVYNYAKYNREIFSGISLSEDVIKKMIAGSKKIQSPTNAPKTPPVQPSQKFQSQSRQSETKVQTETTEKSHESILEKLDKIQHKFIGQERLAKELFFNIINNQYLAEQEEVTDGERSIIFLDGPTGTGKTAITREITKLLNIPFTSTSITNYSSAGYVGGNLTDTLVDLYKKSGGDLKKAEKGIIVLDEFDKIVSHSLNGLEMKRAVQQQLLDFLGGGKYIINVGDKKEEKQVEFDTSRITFVCLGALTDLRTQKTDKRFSLGFASDSTSQSKNDGTYTITPQDLIDLGLERELVGRFNTFLHTDEYDRAALERILRESTISPTKSFEKLLSSHGISLEVDDTVYGAIANSAYELNTGARSLQTVMNNIRTRYLEEIITGKSKNIHLTKDNVETIVQDTMNRRERG